MNNYYTPEVSDIFVGYECEIQVLDFSCQGDGCPKEWEPHIIGHDLDLSDLRDGRHHICVDPRWYRTPYLTKEQIEAEGWERQDNFLNETQRLAMKPDYILKTPTGSLSLFIRDLENPSKNICISEYVRGDGLWDLSSFTTVYDGKCPSINEFRKIIKLCLK